MQEVDREMVREREGEEYLGKRAAEERKGRRVGTRWGAHIFFSFIFKFFYSWACP